MFIWLKKIFVKEPELFLGIIEDDDSLVMEDKILPFKEAVASAAKPEFKKKTLSECRKFPYQYQDGSSSCVTFGMSKIATILYYLLKGKIIKFSPGFWYTERSNKPNEGTSFGDIARLASKGCLLYDLLPSEGLSEKEMNSIVIEQYQRDAADAFALPEHWVELPIDFDTVASTIEKTQKGIKVWFFFGPGEWFGVEKPKIVGAKPWHHDVTAVDTLTQDGKQYILIEDSADSEKYYRKLIDRTFFQARCDLARYPINFKFALGNQKPRYDGTIISVQQCLQYEGKFPTNIPFVENLGPTTRQSIKKFQAENGIEQTGEIGPKTKALLTQKYP